ncbi:hypothetical protein DW355_12315 [Hylemonella gracilis]|uniref:LD-carboxypeptidase N-terminal domain-containing protein n=1 Tax=Hylemonella gracilis TaxID=80880 RepID=A0A4P6UMJ3_9BURK|nr:hypothetical protein DW355_12315 [Hylemonella gracilis]
MSKHIYIYSPSGAVRDKAAFKRGIQRLKALGPGLGTDIEVEIDEAALASQQRFAGDDAIRLAAIRRAAASGADVALITRGGYGLTRILPDLPVKQIHKAIERGTAFVGLSDFTAFQAAVFAAQAQHPGQGGGITWAGPALLEAFGGEGAPDEITQACFEDLLLGQGEGTGWRLPKTPPLIRMPPEPGRRAFCSAWRPVTGRKAIGWPSNTRPCGAATWPCWCLCWARLISRPLPRRRAASCSWRTWASIPTASSAC